MTRHGYHTLGVQTSTHCQPHVLSASMATDSRDPLQRLPPELVLHVLDFVSVSSLASLLRTSRAWNHFIDFSNQDTIYTRLSRNALPSLFGRRNLSCLNDVQCFSKMYQGVATWKELCKRQTLLNKNWSAAKPVIRESIISGPPEVVMFHFQPDFQRRLIICTFFEGRLSVCDMDTGREIWHLEPTLGVQHLAYSAKQGIVCLTAESGGRESVEVWKWHESNRGELERIAHLLPECPGYFIRRSSINLGFDALCFACDSEESYEEPGIGFVYDIASMPPQLKTRMDLAAGGVDLTDQDATSVMYAMGKGGYHIHDKVTGQYIANWSPADDLSNSKIFHIDGIDAGAPPLSSYTDDLSRIYLKPGPCPHREGSVRSIDEDKWTGGIIAGDMLIGFSDGGRLAVCSDWRAHLRLRPSTHVTCTVILEYGLHGHTTQVACCNGRVCIGTPFQLYIIPLDALLHDQNSPSFSCNTHSKPSLTAGRTFVSLTNDAVLHTHTHVRRETINNGIMFTSRNVARKRVRVLSFAPQVEGID